MGAAADGLRSAFPVAAGQMRGRGLTGGGLFSNAGAEAVAELLSNPDEKLRLQILQARSGARASAAAWIPR